MKGKPKKWWTDRIERWLGVVAGIGLIAGLLIYQLMTVADIRQIEVAGLERLVVVSTDNQITAMEAGHRSAFGMTRSVFTENGVSKLGEVQISSTINGGQQSKSKKREITTILEHHLSPDGHFCTIGVSAKARESVSYDSAKRELWSVDGACKGVDIESRAKIMFEQINAKS